MRRSVSRRLLTRRLHWKQDLMDTFLEIDREIQELKIQLVDKEYEIADYEIYVDKQLRLFEQEQARLQRERFQLTSKIDQLTDMIRMNI